VKSTHLVEVDVQALKLLVGSTAINTAGVKAVLARDGLPIIINEYAIRQNAWSRAFVAAFRRKTYQKAEPTWLPCGNCQHRGVAFCAGGQRPRRGKRS
jgi:hypothetical protein